MFGEIPKLEHGPNDGCTVVGIACLGRVASVLKLIATISVVTKRLNMELSVRSNMEVSVNECCTF